MLYGIVCIFSKGLRLNDVVAAAASMFIFDTTQSNIIIKEDGVKLDS